MSCRGRPPLAESVVSSLTARLRESLAAIEDVFRVPELRGLQFAYLASLLSLWSFSVTAAVYAFEIGGAALVGVVMLSRMLPAAIASPFAAALADRYPRRLVLLSTDLVRTGLTGAAAASIWLDLPPATVFALSAVLNVVSTTFAPAKNAILPSLARDPEQLTAANAVTNTFESASIFGGPALGGLLLVFTSIPTAFTISAALLLASAALLWRLPHAPSAKAPERQDLRHELAAGFRVVLGDARLRLLVGMTGAQALVSGMLDVFVVVLALEVLDLGNGGVGLLNAAVGAGGLLGGIVTLTVTSGRRLTPAFALGMVLWGLPLALIAPLTEPWVAVVLLAVVGVGNTLVDVTGITLLQRAVPDDVLGRVFGVLEGIIWGTIGIGAVIAPALISGLGARGALVAGGLLLPVMTALTWPRLVRLDEAAMVPAEELGLLRSVPILAPLEAATLETLALRARRVRFAAGAEVTRQGEPGERFYVIAAGEADVLRDGHKVRREGPGEFFGEIALLRPTPRTATVQAVTELELLALGRDDFVPAVTGHPESAAQADAVIAARLGSARRTLATL
jgi:MFS family permease